MKRTLLIFLVLLALIIPTISAVPAHAGISEADLQVKLTAVRAVDGGGYPGAIRYDYTMTVYNAGPDFAEGTNVIFYTIPTTIVFTAKIPDMYAGTVKTYTWSTLSAAPVHAYFEVQGWYTDPTPGDNRVVIYTGYQVHLPLITGR